MENTGDISDWGAEETRRSSSHPGDSGVAYHWGTLCDMHALTPTWLQFDYLLNSYKIIYSCFNKVKL